jgi:hypothetical protein
MNFAVAVQRYAALGKGKSNIPFLRKIIDKAGVKPIEEVDQDFVDQLAREIYPGATAATINRQIFTPICAVLKAVESKAFRRPPLKRPANSLPDTPIEIPPDEWYAQILEAAPANIAAYILFNRFHGRRTSEGLKIKPAHVEADWHVTVRDNKGKQHIRFRLADEVVEQLNRYPWRLNQYLFGFSSKSRYYKKLKALCKEFGLKYYRPKDAGRHAFATGLLKQGRTLKQVQASGRWKSSKAVERYAHLEVNEVDEKARGLASSWLQNATRKADVISPANWSPAGLRKAGDDK